MNEKWAALHTEQPDHFVTPPCFDQVLPPQESQAENVRSAAAGLARLPCGLPLLAGPGWGIALAITLWQPRKRTCKLRHGREGSCKLCGFGWSWFLLWRGNLCPRTACICVPRPGSRCGGSVLACLLVLVAASVHGPSAGRPETHRRVSQSYGDWEKETETCIERERERDRERARDKERRCEKRERERESEKEREREREREDGRGRGRAGGGREREGQNQKGTQRLTHGRAKRQTCEWPNTIVAAAAAHTAHGGGATEATATATARAAATVAAAAAAIIAHTATTPTPTAITTPSPTPAVSCSM